MLPTSHPVPIHRVQRIPVLAPGGLASAFADFTEVAASLERSYQGLQGEVAQLKDALAERNRALRASLAENAQIRQGLEEILDSLPCGVLVLDASRHVKLSNSEARQLLGVDGTRCLTWNDISRNVRDHLTGLLDISQQGSQELEFCVSGQVGSRWLQVRACNLIAIPNHGQPAAEDTESFCRILILRDVTSQRRLDQEREEARNVVALAEVSAILAHEIRNPLASMELFAGLIADKDPATSTYVSHLRAGVRSLSATVNNVLRFHSGGSWQRTSIVLRESVNAAIEFVRPLAEQRAIALGLQDDSEGVTVVGDPDALQQVFLNLALNSFRHGSAGRLQISIGRSDGIATVVFADDGCGIPPTMLERIFDAGFSGTGQAPGLGLAVCQKILQQHGGSIAVRSQPGCGTTFFLGFPIAL